MKNLTINNNPRPIPCCPSLAQKLMAFKPFNQIGGVSNVNLIPSWGV
jgi:hypothetical protein